MKRRGFARSTTIRAYGTCALMNWLTREETGTAVSLLREENMWRCYMLTIAICLAFSKSGLAYSSEIHIAGWLLEPFKQLTARAQQLGKSRFVKGRSAS